MARLSSRMSAKVIAPGAAILGAAMLVVFTASPSGGLAQEAPGPEEIETVPGHLRALAGPVSIPPGSPIALKPPPNDPRYANDPLYAAARDAIVRALVARGHEVTDDAELTLSINVQQPSYATGREGPTEDRPSTTIRPSADLRSGTVRNTVDIPLGRQPGFQTSLGIEFLLFRRGAAPLWNATVEAAGTIKPPEPLVHYMAAKAMSAFVASVQADFVIRCMADPRTGRTVCGE